MSRPHNWCEKSESLSVSRVTHKGDYNRGQDLNTLSEAQPWLLNHVCDSELLSLPALSPFSCRLLIDPQTHRHCFILTLRENDKAPENLFIDFAWQDFLIKQDQSSSRRSAERTFIDFITTQGIVQRQRVCMPFFSRHYSMMCWLFHVFFCP